MRSGSRLLVALPLLAAALLLSGCPVTAPPPDDPDGGTPQLDGGTQPQDAGPPGSWDTSTWDNATWQ
jgi:hypothetical protein